MWLNQGAYISQCTVRVRVGVPYFSPIAKRLKLSAHNGKIGGSIPSRRTIFIKVLVLVLTAIGLSTMWEAVFADVGVSIIAIVNALRMLKVKKI